MKFSKDHEWVDTSGDLVTIGITDFAQKQLGDIVAIELPKEGDEISAGQSFAVVDSMKASSDVFAPISGVVKEVNSGLLDNPEWINEEPTGKGWIVKVTPSNLEGDSESLMDEDSYNKFTGE